MPIIYCSSWNFLKTTERLRVMENFKAMTFEGDWIESWVSPYVNRQPKPVQSILRKIKKSSKIRQDRQTLIAAFELVFFLSGFSFTEKGGDPCLFHSATSTRSQTFRYLFATLHVRWLSSIFNRNACVYQTATWWDLRPYWNTIWLIDWWCNACLCTWWFDSRFFIIAIWHWKPVDLSSHRLSTLYYERTD